MSQRDLRADVLADAVAAFDKLRTTAERAVEQVDDDAFFTALGPGENSIAVIMKHVGGNLRSRFADFLTTDGEKPDRDRDAEFEVDPVRDSRTSVVAVWERGWTVALASLRALDAADLDRMVTLRGDAMTARRAIDRSLLHIASHVGQIVLLARHHAGRNWRTLSIPRRTKPR